MCFVTYLLRMLFLLSRVNWTATESNLFDKVTKVMSGLRLARLSYESVSRSAVAGTACDWHACLLLTTLSFCSL